jgi:hypothetical protein
MGWYLGVARAVGLHSAGVGWVGAASTGRVGKS